MIRNNMPGCQVAQICQEHDRYGMMSVNFVSHDNTVWWESVTQALNSFVVMTEWQVRDTFSPLMDREQYVQIYQSWCHPSTVVFCRCKLLQNAPALQPQAEQVQNCIQVWLLIWSVSDTSEVYCKEWGAHPAHQP